TPPSPLSSPLRTTTISQLPPFPRHYQDSLLTTTFISFTSSVTTVTSLPPRPPYHRDPHTTSGATPPQPPPSR
ncbi:hypothetical protein Tco_0919095, partial [Tanacetum coccineum]